MARGHLRKRSKGAWTLILELPRDPETGKRKQQWLTVRGTKDAAEDELIRRLAELKAGEYVNPTDQTVADSLEYWLENVIRPSKRLRTHETYESIVRVHFRPFFDRLKLADLNFSHLEGYYRKKRKGGLAEATLEHHHAVLSGCLKWAVRKGLIRRNPAELVDNRPSAGRADRAVKENCWTREEAVRFLASARAEGTQTELFYTVALETGMRKGELCGLAWEAADFDRGLLRIVRQLVKPGPSPVFGPPKRGIARAVAVSPDTLALLRRHRLEQNELKMRNRLHYRDHDLIFAKEWREKWGRNDHLGDPLQSNNIGQRGFRRLIEAAKVRSITFHGLRHTSATLALLADVPVRVVADRLGHKGIEITSNLYQHVLPEMDRDAALRIAGVLKAR
jgi:integrase